MFNTNTYTGTDGVLSLSDARGVPADLLTGYFGESGAVGRVTNVSIAVATQILPFHDLGSRMPKELRAGNVRISGAVERAYINGALLRLLLGQYGTDEEGQTPFAMPAFNLKIILDNQQPPTDDGNSLLTLYDVMFDTWSFTLPEDDFVLERLTFHARRMAVSDTPKP